MALLPQPATVGYEQVELDVDTDRDAIIDLDEWAFAFYKTPETRQESAFTPERDRTIGVRHTSTGDLVGVHASFAFTMATPGGELPTAGLTWVGVHPGHRRKGLATMMVRTHLARTAERREPLSALFAAEPEIYPRFGYGMAATDTRLTLGHGAALRDVPGTDNLTCSLERLDAARHRDVILEVLRRSARPGTVVPANEAIIANMFADSAQFREGAELYRIAIVRDCDETPQAFAIFRRVEKWDDARPAGVLQVRHSVANSGAASRLLWSTLVELDLMASIKTSILAVDDPLISQLVNLRTAHISTSDNVWIRIVNLPEALAGRRYAAPLDVVLDVTDTVLPDNAGRWRVSGGPTAATVRKTDDPADVALDVRDLGAAYLGGVPLAALGAAGLVTELTPGALAAASTAFGWHQAPVCTWDF